MLIHINIKTLYSGQRIDWVGFGLGISGGSERVNDPGSWVSGWWVSGKWML